MLCYAVQPGRALQCCAPSVAPMPTLVTKHATSVAAPLPALPPRHLLRHRQALRSTPRYVCHHVMPSAQREVAVVVLAPVVTAWHGMVCECECALSAQRRMLTPRPWAPTAPTPRATALPTRRSAIRVLRAAAAGPAAPAATPPLCVALRGSSGMGSVIRSATRWNSTTTGACWGARGRATAKGRMRSTCPPG